MLCTATVSLSRACAVASTPVCTSMLKCRPPLAFLSMEYLQEEPGGENVHVCRTLSGCSSYLMGLPVASGSRADTEPTSVPTAAASETAI